MEWTKSSDQLPKQGIYVVWGLDGVWRSTQAVFIPQIGWMNARGESMTVTHWMEYPEAPEGATQNPPKKIRAEV